MIEISEKRKVPPDGGWGYLVAFALPLSMNVTLMPTAAFGLLFGSFLSGLGDETTGTALTIGAFDATFSFTGFLANGLLSKYSYRVVALIGASIFTLGAIMVIFVESLWQMIVFYGIIQGMGVGLMLPAFYTALNSYFDKKLGVINGLTQTLLVGGTMAIPAIAKFLLDSYGFRGALICLAALGLNAFLAASVLQPVEWHMVEDKSKECHLQESDALLQTTDGHFTISAKPRLSIVSINSITLSGHFENPRSDDNKSFWHSLVRDFDLTILKDGCYLNIAIGIALGFVSDLMFISILPLVLVNDDGFDDDRATRMLTLFFGANFIGNLVLSLVSGYCNLNNRYLFLSGIVVSAIFRTVFNYVKGFWWAVINISVLGFLRTFIQTPIPLIIADKYGDRFANAYSLYMVICGVVSLSMGFLISLVKSYTETNIYVVHLLTSLFIICTISWIIEFIFTKIRK